MTTTALTQRNYFTDPSLLVDPYEYFRQLHAKGTINPVAGTDILMITGYDEAVEVLRNNQDFSSAICTSNLAEPFPYPPGGNDFSEQIDAFRESLNELNLFVAYDGPAHSNLRHIAGKLFTPSRLKATHDFMYAFADQLVLEVVRKGKCELVNEVATPFVTLVIAELLGVPPDDRDKFRKVIDDAPAPANLDANAENKLPPLVYMAMFFMEYIQDRRTNPRKDTLTDLALATYPDGSLPDLMEMVKLSGFLFGAGQDTSAKLLGNAIRYITDVPGLQQQLREDPSLIPALILEVLRLEGSSKATFRIARYNTQIGDRKIPAGTRLAISLAAANRDPRRWDEPDQFRLKRPRIQEHLAFGRGIHTCAGAPLARLEVRAILERFLEHTSHIKLSEEHHGKVGNRRLTFEPSYVIRGLSELHVEFEA